MWPDSRICELFGVTHPIVLAPMAGSGGPDLAIAVSQGGGLGSLPCASLNLDQIRQQLTQVREHTPHPISLNFFCHEFNAYDESAERAWQENFSTYAAELGVTMEPGAESSNKTPFHDAHCALIEELRPEVASFHFGLPKEALLERVKQAGCRVISSANTVAEAVWLEQRGCDAVIAQGTEAGGHRAMFLSESVSEQAGTLALVPQIVDAVDVPVIAAGGIADGRGIAAAFALGASGVQIGTAYLLTPESLVNEIYRQKLVSARDDGTVVTNVFSGRPARGFANRLTRELGPIHDQPMDFPMGYGVLGPFQDAAEATGSTELSSYLSGQSAALGREEPALALTARLVDEAHQQFQRLAGKL